MDEKKLLEAILLQLKALTDRVEKYAIDLSEFSDRFEEVVAELADERRLDLMSREDYN
jgi:hypothetical protein